MEKVANSILKSRVICGRYIEMRDNVVVDDEMADDLYQQLVELMKNSTDLINQIIPDEI